MNLRARLAVIVLVCAAGRAGCMPLHASFGVTADGGGTSVDAGLEFAPHDRFSFEVGLGHSSSSGDSGNLSGTLLNAGASLHGERLGVSLDFSSFDDGANYRARTLAARAWIAAGDFEFALLGRQRANAVTLTLDLPLRTARRTVDFAGTGGGIQVSFARASVNAYALALRYEYDDELERFLTLADSPQLVERPRIEALVGSFMTQAQGAVDRQVAAGVERNFGRHAIALDFASVHDALLESHSVSAALTYHRVQSARLDWSISAGMLDSDAYGNAAFAGIAIGLSN